MALRVWLPRADTDAFLGPLRAALDPRVALHVGELPAEGPSPRVLVRGSPTAGQLDACAALERVIVPFAGVPEATRALLAERPHLALHNLHHNAAPTAELAVALLLAVAKRVLPLDRALRAGDWRPRYAPPESRTLAEGDALVLGYGAIGQRVARALTGLGMRVTAVRRSAAEGDRHGMVALAPPRALSRLLPRADAVLACLPLTAETRGLLDARALAALPAGALLVNVGRGALVDEDALYDALAQGRLGGAGLDVWYRYPEDEAARAATLPSHRPFHELENVVLSPHRAGLTRENEASRARALAALLNAAARGAPVPDRVDPARGY